MKKRAYMVLPLVIFLVTVLLNGIVFYSTKCNTEYLESTNYLGETQSISRQSMLMQKQILENLPEDKKEAIKYLVKVIHLMYREKDEPLPGTTYAVSQKEYATVYELILEAEKYDDMRMGMEETVDRLSQIDLFEKEGYNEALVYTAKDFYGLSNLDIPIIHDNGINIWTNYKVTDYLVVLMAAAGGVCFSLYRKESLKRQIQKKQWVLLPGLLLFLLAALGMYFTNGLFMEKYLYPYDMNTLLQSFPAFYSYPSPQHLWVYMVEVVAVKLLLGGLIFGFAVALCHISGKKRLISGIGGAIFLAVEWFLYLQSGVGAISLLFREINIFSAFSYERFFLSYQNLTLFGVTVGRKGVFFIFMTLLSVAMLLWVRYLVKSYTGKVMEKLQFRYYEEINQKYTETRQLWHDFHNHLLTIQELMRHGEFEQANHYMTELEEEIDNTHILTRTGMGAVDVLLYQKSQLAKSLEIQLDIQIQALLKEEQFQAVAVCCIVGNLLDNCIEAVKQLPKERRQIQFEISQKGDMLYIFSKNPYEGTIERDAKGIKTTKQDKLLHGFGLKGVERVCERYGGSMLIDTADNSFQVQALLMAKNK